MSLIAARTLRVTDVLLRVTDVLLWVTDVIVPPAKVRAAGEQFWIIRPKRAPEVFKAWLKCPKMICV